MIFLLRRWAPALFGGLVAAACILGGGAAAADYPDQPIRLVVPFPAGGGADNLARMIMPRVEKILGQPIVIDNRPGAGGNVGAEVVARAAPDGYMLLLANPSLAISPLIYPKLNYRPTEDFAYVGQYGTVPNVLVVHPSIPARNVQEFIAYVKKNPGRLNYGSPGYGTSPQMSSELFKAMTDTFIVHIPFRGSGPAQAAMLGGEIQMMIDNLPPQLAHIKSGKVRALAVTSLTRSSVLPEVPTMDEAGLKGYEVTAWFGLAAPAATPRPVIMRLNEALNRAMQDPQTHDAFVSRGATIVTGTPEQFRDFIKGEMVKWEPIVKRANIVPD